MPTPKSKTKRTSPATKAHDRLIAGDVMQAKDSPDDIGIVGTSHDGRLHWVWLKRSDGEGVPDGIAVDINTSSHTEILRLYTRLFNLITVANDKS